MSNDTIKRLQSHCPVLRSLHKHLDRKCPTKSWPGHFEVFSRYVNKLSVVDNIFVFCSPTPVIVILFSQMIEITILILVNFAHVRRDKVLDLLYDLMWHPSNYMIVNDVCITCHQCQILKEFSRRSDCVTIVHQ